nr:unnamed protein product [Callosobruchus chinensis]
MIIIIKHFLLQVYTGKEHRRSSSTGKGAPLTKTRSDGEVPVVPAGERNSGGGGGYHHHPATASPTATAAAAAAAATAAAGGWPPGLSLELDPVAAAWGRKLYPGTSPLLLRLISLDYED